MERRGCSRGACSTNYIRRLSSDLLWLETNTGITRAPPAASGTSTNTAGQGGLKKHDEDMGQMASYLWAKTRRKYHVQSHFQTCVRRKMAT